MATFSEERIEKEFDVCAKFPARELVEKERAVELAASLKEEASSYRRIKLSNKSYSPEAASIMAEALKSLESAPSSFDISDVIAGRPEADALQTLEFFAKAFPKEKAENIISIDVSDNALGQKGIDALLPLFNDTNLQVLRVCNNGMSAAAAQQLAEILFGLTTSEQKTASNLRIFHFHNNMSGDEGAVYIAKIIYGSPKLIDLKFSGTRAGRPGSLAVTQSLLPLTQLQRLDLIDNTLGEDGADALAQFIESSRPPLRYLDLRDCALGNEGWQLIATALSPLSVDRQTSCLLQHLDISGNDLEHEACGTLAAVFRAHPKLSFFAIEENDIQLEGLQTITRAIADAKPPKLSFLNIATNDINAAHSVIRLAATIRSHCPQFTLLNIDGNGISDDILPQLVSVLGGDHMLASLEDNDGEAINEDQEPPPDSNDLAALLSGLSVSSSSP